MSDHAVFVNPERTVLVRIEGGQVTVAFRSNPDEAWGPPIILERAQ